jgi:hypothetical protein
MATQATRLTVTVTMVLPDRSQGRPPTAQRTSRRVSGTGPGGDARTESRTTAKDMYYVAISRARHEARIYTNDRRALPVAVERENVKHAALDLVRDAHRSRTPTNSRGEAAAHAPRCAPLRGLRSARHERRRGLTGNLAAAGVESVGFFASYRDSIAALREPDPLPVAPGKPALPPHASLARGPRPRAHEPSSGRP